MHDKKLKDYLDKNFNKLIKRYADELQPANFFIEKWEDCEEIPIYNRYAHISFLNKFSQEEKDLYLLKYSLRHLDTLVSYYCENGNKKEIKNTLLMVTISCWEIYPEEYLRFNFFITYKCNDPYWISKPFAQPHTKQSSYIIELLKKLNIADDYIVCDDRPPINKELQRVYVGLKKHPDPNLITLDHFVGDSRTKI